MTRRGHRSGNNNSKREKVSESGPFLSKWKAVKYVSSFKSGRRRGRRRRRRGGKCD